MAAFDFLKNLLGGSDDTLLSPATAAAGGASQPFSWGGLASDVAPYGVLGVLSMLASQSAANQQHKLTQEQQLFTAGEDEKNRALSRELAAAAQGNQLALAKLSAKIAQQNMVQGAYGHAADTTLSGGQMKMGAIGKMIDSIQRGLGR